MKKLKDILKNKNMNIEGLMKLKGGASGDTPICNSSMDPCTRNACVSNAASLCQSTSCIQLACMTSSVDSGVITPCLGGSGSGGWIHMPCTSAN